MILLPQPTRVLGCQACTAAGWAPCSEPSKERKTWQSGKQQPLSHLHSPPGCVCCPCAWLLARPCAPRAQHGTAWLPLCQQGSESPFSPVAWSCRYHGGAVQGPQCSGFSGQAEDSLEPQSACPTLLLRAPPAGSYFSLHRGLRAAAGCTITIH